MLKQFLPPSRLPTPFFNQTAIIHGADYNPDQWLPMDEGILDDDARLMREVGMNGVSLGIFAWTALEPSEGKFTFDWMDRVMDKQASIGNRVILATPTGAMPTWLAYKYPEARRVDAHGIRSVYGWRHNHCWTSPAYHERVQSLNSRLAERYKNHPALSMWHVSNELNGHCLCNLCRAQWAKWLENRYGTLKQMNDAFWAYFWSHQATAWNQVEPTDTVMDGMRLDWMRFTNEQLVNWYKFERDILRAITPNIPITTNFMGLHGTINYSALAREVDVVDDDQYPSYDAQDPQMQSAATLYAMKHDLYRCFKPQRTQMIMESCPGAVQWRLPQKAKRPGIHRLEMLQAIAHGSDGTCYFQFRAGRGSGEKLHGAVVEHWGTQRNSQTRRFRELRALSDTYEKIKPVLGTSVHAQVAILYDWESKWAQQFSGGTGTHAPAWQTERGHYYDLVCAEQYAQFWKRGIPVDLLSGGEDFSRYKLVILPMHWIMTDALAQRLEAYVKGGGTVVATWDTGMSDEHNRMLLGGWPGLGLDKVFGLWVEEVDRLLPGTPRAISGLPGSGGDVAAVAHLLGAKALAQFAEDYYKAMPAVTVHHYGQGHAYFIGTRLDATASSALYGPVIDQLKLEAVIDRPLPDGVTAQLRGAGDEAFVFLMNFSSASRTVDPGSRQLTNLETGQAVNGPIVLQPFDAVVYRAR